MTWVMGIAVKVGRRNVAPGGNSAFNARSSLYKLSAGDRLEARQSGIVQFNVRAGKKRVFCRTYPDGLLEVKPRGNVLLRFLAGRSFCATLPTPGLKVMKLGAYATVTARDPVFEIDVGRQRSVVTVRRGAVVVSGKGGARRSVVVANDQQTVVGPGREPTSPRGAADLTAAGRLDLDRMARVLPGVRDVTPPETRIVEWPQRQTSSTSATFVFQASESPVVFSCALDGVDFRVCAGRVTFEALSRGPHTLSVRATDAEGNVGRPARHVWNVSSDEGTGSRQVIARNATDERLEVDAEGRALVSYRSDGRLRTVLAWGAIDALPPTEGQAQVRFKLLYSAPPIRNVCRPYTGPPLAFLVTACTAPDGTHWALQEWQRGLPNYGFDPTPAQAAWELRLSHWSGPLAQLEIKTDWAYRKYDHLYGRLTFQGQPVHGFASTGKGVPLDSFGRNIYVDTYDSAYGPGWRRENSFLTHRPTGAFCYGFYPRAGRPQGGGTRYRAIVIGPGVTPDVVWEGPAPGAYDAARDQAANLEQRQLLGQDKLCKIN